MTPEQELTIRKNIGDTLLSITELERVELAPIEFASSSDFWASDESVDYDTLEELDQHSVFCAWLCFRGFTDLEDGDENAPTVNYLYDLYIFAQADFERANELTTGDQLQRLMYKTYNKFVASIIAIKEAYQGRITISDLDSADFTDRVTLPISTQEEVQELVECRFIPLITGYSTTLRLTAQVQEKAC